KQHGWRPLLVVNERARGSKSFDETGTLFAPEGGQEKMGKAVRGTFGSALSGASGSSTTTPTSVLTAEWMDISLTCPGRAPVKVRREVFDSIGPGVRASAVNGPISK